MLTLWEKDPHQSIYKSTGKAEKGPPGFFTLDNFRWLVRGNLLLARGHVVQMWWAQLGHFFFLGTVLHSGNGLQQGNTYFQAAFPQIVRSVCIALFFNWLTTMNQERRGMWDVYFIRQLAEVGPDLLDHEQPICISEDLGVAVLGRLHLPPPRPAVKAWTL